jgi:hypothetical protein
MLAEIKYRKSQKRYQEQNTDRASGLLHRNLLCGCEGVPEEPMDGQL